MDSLRYCDVARFYKIYMDFSYFLLISPVRLIQDAKSGLYSMRTFLPQKLLSALASILSCCWIIAEMRKPIETSSKVKAEIWFNTMLQIMMSLTKLATLKMFWWNNHDILMVVNFLVKNSGSGAKALKPPTKRKLLVIILCLVYALMGITNWLTGRNLGHIRNWSVTWWWDRIVSQGCYNFFLPNSTCIRLSATPAWKSTLGLLSAFGFYQRQVLVLFSLLNLLMGILILWCSSKSLAALLQQDVQNQPKEDTLFILTQKWKHLKNTKPPIVSHQMNTLAERIIQLSALENLCNLVNKLYGSSLSYFLIGNVLFYSTEFFKVFIKESKNFDGLNAFRFLFFFANDCMIVWFAADVPFLMHNAVREWIKSESIREGMGMGLLNILLCDLQANEISMKAGGIFPVTYDMFAHMVGLTVTYFVICIQTREPGVTAA